MNNQDFNDNINSILDSGKIENISIPNTNIIKNIVLDNNLNRLIYNDFMKNYQSEYGNDSDFFVMKIQDLLYRLHLLINHIIIDKFDVKDEGCIYDAVLSYVMADTINLYDAVNYNDTDLEEFKCDLMMESEGLNIG